MISAKQRIQNIMIKKPPLGIIPRNIHREHRIDDIRAAVYRHMDATHPIPKKWIKEYNNLIKKTNPSR